MIYNQSNLKVRSKRPEAEWSNHEQVEENAVALFGGPNSCL